MNKVNTRVCRIMQNGMHKVSSLLYKSNKNNPLDVEKEVLDILSMLDIPKKSDLKEFSRRINELSKKVEA